MSFILASLAPVFLAPALTAQSSAQAAAPPVQQSAPRLSLEQQTALRCSAAFALVASGQDIGNEASLAYPPLNERGKEFFVRTMAGLMDDTGMTREQLVDYVAAEAQALWDEGTIDQTMPGCLLLLDASGV